MGHVTWVTIILASIPEAFFILLIAVTSIGYKVDFKKIFLMSVIEGIFFYIYMNYLLLPVDIHSWIVTLILILLIHFFFKIDFKSCFIGVTFSTMISFLIQYLNLIYIYILNLKYNNLLENETLRILFFYPSLILLGIIAFIIYKKNIVFYKFYIKKENMDYIIDNKAISTMFLILNFIMIVVFDMYVKIFGNDIFSLKEKINLIIVACLFLMLFLVLMMIFRFVDKNIKNQYETILIEKSLEDMKKNINILKKQRHDYLRHMQIISSLLDDSKFESAKNYIDNLTDYINSEAVYIDTGNIFLNAVISLKDEQSKHKQIEFRTNIKARMGKLKIPNFEICNIVSNVIDNAFDALDEIEQNNKYVELTVYGDDLCYIVKIKNNGKKIGFIDRIFEEGFSTKKGTDRGFGLYIVRQTLEKYKSSIFVESDENITEFSIVIPKY
ncbi:sensor histidine kinase [Tepidibacter mesophilus]|uniref:sensor histidine kinase n=1 Tax=Tepidibacter mesophilus TaxID=655607 RepID=UPI000C06B386|nr:GHKL domain-containing protein [Tepidibacter mesophilus]